MGRSRPKEMSWQVYKFSDSVILEKIVLFLLSVNANPTPLDHVRGVFCNVFNQKSLNGQCSWPLIPICGRMSKLEAGILDCQLLSFGNDTPHVISYGCKKGH
jgi:hypothetical protein